MKLGHFYSCFLLIISISFCNPIIGQRHVDLPVVSQELGLNIDRIPSIQMEEIDVDALLLEDERANHPDGKMRFAFPYKTEIDLVNESRVDVLNDGSKVYRLHIDCPNAKNINFLYSNFYIPAGGRLHIYNRDQSEVLGAFTERNNPVNGKYATAVVNDERATLEYYEPANSKHPGHIVISQVGYGYRSFAVTKKESRGPGDSGSCQVDINCVPEGNDWQDEKKGVGRITSGGSDWCTGCLLRNVEDNCEPLFLTADHCLPSGVDAVTNPDLSSFVFYFNYEYPGCNVGGTANLSESVSGGNLLANDSPSDFALVELNENPIDEGIDVYFAGWDARNQTPVSGGVGIHHPSGDAKKIATHSQVPVSSGWGGSGNDHWTVNWDATTNGHSVTEGGSSGSPIFDANSRVLGQLHGGSSINCSDPANDPGVYGKVSYSWLNNGATDNRRKLQPWLDPDNTGTMFMDGSYPVACTTNKIQFNNVSTSMLEGSDCDSFPLSLTVSILNPPLASVSVDVIASGSGVDGEDYMLNTTTLTFSSGASASQQVNFFIIQDGVIESDENIIFTLSNLTTTDTTVALGANNSHEISLINDDIGPSPSSTGDFVVGSGASSTSGVYSPFRGYWEDARFQIIYRASDLIAAGMQAGLINSIAFDVASKGSTQAYTDFTVGLKHSNIDTYTSPNFESGFTQVFTGDLTTTAGWNTIVFDSPFDWDGVSNIMIETCFNNDSWTANDVVRYDDMGYDVENMNRADDVDGCTMGGNYTYDYRPQIRFNIDAGSNIQTVINSVSGYSELPLGPNETVHFYDVNTNKIMATIENLSSHDFGCTRVEIDQEGVDETAWIDGYNVSNKNFKITPEYSDSTASVSITLFFDTTELVTFLPNINSMVRADMAISDPGNTASNTNVASATETSFGMHHQFTGLFDSGLGGFALSDKPLECPDTIQVSGVISENQTYLASDHIRTNGLTVIQNGAAVYFDAGNFIELKEDFEVILGSELTIRIRTCGN